MKTALVPLVLLGAKASGCHLRGGQPAASGDLANESGLFSKLMPSFRQDEVVLARRHSPRKKNPPPSHKGMPTKKRDWFAARSIVAETCGEEAMKNHCGQSPGLGGIFKMVRCLSSDHVLSDECETAIKDWRNVMTPSVRRVPGFDAVEQAIDDPDLENWLESPFDVGFEDETGEPAGYTLDRGVLPLDDLFLADTIRVRHSFQDSPLAGHYDRAFGPLPSADGNFYGLGDEILRHDLQVDAAIEHGRPGHGPPGRGPGHAPPPGHGPGHAPPPGHGPGHAPPRGRGPPGQGPPPPVLRPPGHGPYPHERVPPGHRHPDDGRHGGSMFSVLVDWIGGGSSDDSSVSSDSWSSDSWEPSSSSSSDSLDSPFFSGKWRQNPKGWEKSELLAGGSPGNHRVVGRPGHPARVFRHDEKAVMSEMALSRSHTGFHEHNNRNERGDHIRFRNRLPDEYEEPAWFDDLDDGVNFTEGVLGFFFVIGIITLMSLPFFLLALVIKTLVLLARRSHSSAASPQPAAPEGYQTLPEAASDDDAVVVTGTPVNPPPSARV